MSNPRRKIDLKAVGHECEPHPRGENQVALKFNQSRTTRIANKARELRGRLLDVIYAPVISRLTDEQYFACRTRNDCLRAYLGLNRAPRRA